MIGGLFVIFCMKTLWAAKQTPCSRTSWRIQEPISIARTAMLQLHFHRLRVLEYVSKLRRRLAFRIPRLRRLR